MKVTPVALAAGCLAVVLLTPLVPTATAQAGLVTPTLTVSVTDPGEDLVTTRPTSLELRVRYAYGPGATTNEPVSVTLEVTEQPNWTSSLITRPVMQFTIPPEHTALGGAQERLTTVNLTLDPTAPARVKEDFVMKATSTARGNLAAAETLSPRVGLAAKFVPNIIIVTSGEVVARGGYPTLVPFTITNAGNGDSDIQITLTSRPENSLVTFPDQITLARDASTVIELEMRVPWSAAERGLLEIEAVALRGGPDTERFRAGVEVVGRSVVPGGEAVAALVMVGAAALVLRRR